MDELRDRLDVIDLLNRYGVAIDARDWDLFRTVFHVDCVADYGAHGRWDDLKSFVDLFEVVHERWPATQHVITNHQVVLDGDTATARSYINATLVSPGAEGGDTVAIRGYYDDELERTPEGWRIRHRRFHPFWYEGNLALCGYQPGETPRSEPPWTLRTS